MSTKPEPETGVLQVRRIGASIGVLPPKEHAARLDLRAGDKRHVVEAADRA